MARTPLSSARSWVALNLLIALKKIQSVTAINESRFIQPTVFVCKNAFYDDKGSQQAFTAFRQVAEHLLLVNILRYFHLNCDSAMFNEIAFVMDGPLAIFGMPAWLKGHIQNEIERIHHSLLDQGRRGLLIIGIEKTGEFVDHFEELDWLRREGRRQRLTNGTILIPTTEYIYKYITPSTSDKAYGEAVYYGRKLMYKNGMGQHAIAMTPIVNDEGRKRNSVGPEVFPRLNDALNMIDNLYTHLYQDGFAPPREEQCARPQSP